jgi:hypothetical protein
MYFGLRFLQGCTINFVRKRGGGQGGPAKKKAEFGIALAWGNKVPAWWYLDWL